MALMWYEMSSFLLQEQAAEEILHSNRHSLPFGLQLTKQQALELAETRSRALHACGRVEFGAGMIGKLAEAFCSSPYLSRETYAETLNELVELFYLYKSETGERVTDDGLYGCRLLERFRLSLNLQANAGKCLHCPLDRPQSSE